MIEDEAVLGRIDGIIRDGVDADAKPGPSQSDPFWKGLKNTGTELWLDTGDIDAAESLWNDEFTALTTNNTLLNNEIQKGIYDELIEKAGKLLGDLSIEERIMEIAFILNGSHGLNLVNRFGGYVSVELHTASARDIDMTVHYARRFHKISPERFIIKIPLTPEGLIATRLLRDEGVPVNFTLGFSARQNYLASAFAYPSYVNVFLGRLGAYVADNALGDGNMVGEKATISSQRHVKAVSAQNGKPTLQIAASMRSAAQVKDLAGVDVYTMPVKVATAAKEELTGSWESCVDREYEVSFNPGIDEQSSGLSVLWDVSDSLIAFAEKLDSQPPATGDELVERAHGSGAGDLFPRMSPEDKRRIAADGKIPVHKNWKKRIEKGELAVDSLLNLAGLASFTVDQGKLDDRIRGLIA
jgi:transaldolase